MVRGLDTFRERFRDFDRCFLLIGGAACHEWFASQGLHFRATRDLDIVLVVEMLDAAFVAELRRFVADGGYALQYRTDGSPVLYRFDKPAHPDFPHMLELFSRHPKGIFNDLDQHIMPISHDPEHHSLSAILLEQDYYELLLRDREIRDGLPYAGATALIALKARAWLDLTERRRQGGAVDLKNIHKHRTDVFRLATSLAARAAFEVSPPVRRDLNLFLQAFPDDAMEWPAIMDALRVMLPSKFQPAELRGAVQTHFGLSG